MIIFLFALGTGTIIGYLFCLAEIPALLSSNKRLLSAGLVGLRNAVTDDKKAALARNLGLSLVAIGAKLAALFSLFFLILFVPLFWMTSDWKVEFIYFFTSSLAFIVVVRKLKYASK